MRGVPQTIHKPLIDFRRNIKSYEKADLFYPSSIVLTVYYLQVRVYSV